MGTKNNPGAFDCYANAHPDEPMFVLLGRDPFAPGLVLLWAALRREMGEDENKVLEAIDCAGAMAAWAIELGKAEASDAAAIALEIHILEMASEAMKRRIFELQKVSV